MTYPPQNGPAGQNAGSDYPDYSAQPGLAGQGGYGGQDRYGVQSSFGATAAYPENPSGRPGPPSNIGWAVASILFFWPLSFVAMTRAMDVYPLWAAGRHAEAEAASASAKKLGLISLAIVAVLCVLYIVFIIAMVGLAASGY